MIDSMGDEQLKEYLKKRPDNMKTIMVSKSAPTKRERVISSVIILKYMQFASNYLLLVILQKSDQLEFYFLCRKSSLTKCVYVRRSAKSFFFHDTHSLSPKHILSSSNW